MRRNPRDLQRYNASERANHWAVGWLFLGGRAVYDRDALGGSV